MLITPPGNLHAWNQQFMWADAAPRGGRLDQEACDVFNTNGYLIVRGAIDVGAIAAIRALTDEREATEVARLEADGGRRGISEVGAITFNVHLVSDSTDLQRFVRHEVFAGLALDLVGPDVNLYWDQTVYKQPEKPRRFPWHQDNGYVYVEPQQYLTCWVPLVPATKDNGCPQLVAGLHRFGTLEHSYVEPLGWQCFDQPPAEPVLAEVEPGDIVVFSSLTPHLTGPNLTAETRKAYILQYAPFGAAVVQGAPMEGAPTGRVPCDDPRTQIAVLRGGHQVSQGSE
jgi:phytanoyl-CoA hydroxylase